LNSRFVYILRSVVDPTRFYAGLTSDVGRRLETHNSRGSIHTIANRPWTLVVAIEFSSVDSALKFEQYVKRERRRMEDSAAPAARAEERCSTGHGWTGGGMSKVPRIFLA
jgi:predicted GIY-YIG superfamily endonuclease